MQVQKRTIEILDALQTCDLAILQGEKKLAALPQRAEIIKLRKKIELLESKEEEVGQLRLKTEKKLQLVIDEDQRIAAKQSACEQAIAEGGDYRNLEARTKELNGYVKRRTTLNEELETIEADLSKVSQLESQVKDMLDQTRRLEQQQVDSFKSEGGALKNELAREQMHRSQLLSGLDKITKNAYEKSFARNGGIAIAHLVNGKCSTCRSVIDGPHLSTVKSEAPLSQCPSCYRLMIVD